MTVQEAARFLGVSPQTVYAWVERRQIPHLRVMGSEHPVFAIGARGLSRLIQTEGGEWHDRKSITASLYRRGRFWWMRYRDRDGTRRLESTGTADWQEAQTRLRQRLQARDENVLSLVRRGQQLTFNE